jgi:hypothetical protein
LLGWKGLEYVQVSIEDPLLLISLSEAWDAWHEVTMTLEPMGEPQTREYYTNVGSVNRLIKGTIYRIEPSRKNGRPRVIFISEDITEKKELENELERKRKKIEEMDELMNIFMKFFENSPLVMGSVYLQDDDIVMRLMNPPCVAWLLRSFPRVKEHFEEGKPLTSSKN